VDGILAAVLVHHRMKVLPAVGTSPLAFPVVPVGAPAAIAQLLAHGAKLCGWLVSANVTHLRSDDPFLGRVVLDLNGHMYTIRAGHLGGIRNMMVAEIES